MLWGRENRTSIDVAQMDDPVDILIGVDNLGQVDEFGNLLKEMRYVGDQSEGENRCTGLILGLGGTSADQRGDGS